MLTFPDEGITVAGVRGPLTLDDALFQVRKSARIAALQLARADRIVGTRHVRSAALHALRAQAEGRMQANTLETEFMRYLAGERQVKSALTKMGLAEENETVVVVGFGAKAKDAVHHFVEALGLREDDSVLEANDAKLAAFGVTEQQLASTTPARRFDIALEHVALVDLMRS